MMQQGREWQWQVRDDDTHHHHSTTSVNDDDTPLPVSSMQPPMTSHHHPHCHIYANSNTSPTCSDASPTNSDISPISSDVSPTNSDVSPPNSYSVPLVRLARFCHTFRYIPCFLPVTYLSPCCYLLLPCVYPFHVLLPLMCFSYSAFHMPCAYHKDPVLPVSI